MGRRGAAFKSLSIKNAIVTTVTKRDVINTGREEDCFFVAECSFSSFYDQIPEAAVVSL